MPVPVAPRSVLESLTDPTPPVPGRAERAAVDARAHRLVRRRRALQGAAALGCTALIGVGVVALVATAGTGPSATGGVETASAPDPGTTATAPEPPTASVTVTAPGVPAGVTLHVTLVGDGGTFAADTTTGVVSFDGIPPGDYEARWDWASSDGATATGRFPVTLVAGTNDLGI